MEVLILNLYFELLKTPVFTVEDVNKYYDNMDSARSAIKRLMKEGMVAKIRNNMYTCISGETGAPVANRFQIASKITPTSYVSHHTAMEYYGITDQVYYEVYVASETSFREFEFDGYTYRYVASKDMDKIAGIEEVIQDIGSMKRMQEKRVLKYLDLLSNQFLYQKMGFLLSEHKEKMGLSDEFFDTCKSQIGKSKRYLTKDMSGGRYVDEWKLVIPENIYNMKNGVIEDATI